jgi:hypothetical protein
MSWNVTSYPAGSQASERGEQNAQKVEKARCAQCASKHCRHVPDIYGSSPGNTPITGEDHPNNGVRE